MKALISQLEINKILPRLFTGWCLAALVETLLNPEPFTVLSFGSAVVLWRFIASALLITAVLTALAVKWDTILAETSLLCGAAFGYMMLLAYYEHDFWFSLGLTFVMLCVCIYALHKDRLGGFHLHFSKKTALLLIAAAALLFAAYSAAVTVCRYKNFSSSTYDFGIFSQMFYYMKETGLPLTTCERDGLVSHFAVHISPIWYLLLPGYMLFQSPVYLQIMQAVILASGVIPLYLLSKQLGHSRNTQSFLCLCYCFFPALIGGQFYDIHENLFLTPLLLWLFYFYEKRQILPLWIFAVLTLLVKEDAAIYVAAITLYMICGRRDHRLGWPLLAVSVAYFFAATALLSALGDGVMTASRFGAYLPEGSNSMIDVLKTVLLNPGFLFKQVFTADKVKFMLLMLLPVAFLPLCSKKISQLLLLIPMLVVNIMPNWEYQYSIHFQYVFGSIALIFYLAALNLKALPGAVRRFALPAALSFALLLSMAHMSAYADNITSCIQNAEEHATITAALDKIPEDASVVSHGYMLPAVTDRKIVYDYSTGKDAEYIVLDLRPGRESDAADASAYYAAQPQRYTCIALHEDLVAVFRDMQYVY